ncbi:uncharacterized protein MELLADRAFT_85609 [Melampsora larici-populina 98AG31]|uniref:Uncharacterized protein n=1 Tax=Melampsora larici-populina (strain 98AG31 / pathotype 3-4-7) TaxID=747676 RepID=F4SDA9_MELLP|nr:uncharacterized protein MELLADRAFT_85609 [Melampsora larici-populina 98AG31]EGF97369.1 hypothetical protein MELLADRAFT_85609 [Melampsora larici-populina 98AG31]
MPPATKLKNKHNAHRVPCICRTHDCYLGQYVDAHGVTRAGVEVLPETLATHQLADRVRQATLSGSQRTQTVNQNDPNNTAALNTLVGTLSHLGLNSINPSSFQGYSPLHRHTQILTGRSQASEAGLLWSENEASKSGIQESTPVQTTHARSKGPLSDQDSDEASSLPKICTAATSAKTAGVQIYNWD